MKNILWSLLLFSNFSHAAMMINTMTGFSSNNDSKTSTDISDVSNHIFVGASLNYHRLAISKTINTSNVATT